MTDKANNSEEVRQAIFDIWDDEDEENEIFQETEIENNNEPKFQEVEIDGDIYDFEIEETPKFVAVTTIGHGTGNIFLAEGATKAEARNNGLDAILPENMWEHATIYDTTKRKNLRIVSYSKAKQLGYKPRTLAITDDEDTTNFGAY